jgi:hypothetical protein
MLFPLLGRLIAERSRTAWMRGTIAGTAALVLATVSVIGLHTRFDLLRPAIAAFGGKDPTSEGVDWTSLGDDLAARGLLPPGTLVGLPNWRDGGKIARGLGPGVTVTVLNRDARQFGLTRPARTFVGRDMLVLIAERPEATIAALAPLFRRLEPLPPAPVTLRGRVLRQITVLRGEGLLRWPP